MNNEIKDELKEIAVFLAGIGNENCYRVPENYFEELADEVMSNIHLPSASLPFSPPAPSYFEELADTILARIKSNGTIVEADNEVAEELKELSPVLAGIKKVNVYAVPEQYFTNFKVALPAADKEAKVVVMRSPVRWMRYAAAAAVVGIVAVSSIFYFKNDNGNNTGNARFTITKNYSAPLSSLSDDAITNYLEESAADVDIAPSAYDDSKLNAGSLTQQLLKDVSDSEIQEYLQENQQPGEKDIKNI